MNTGIDIKFLKIAEELKPEEKSVKAPEKGLADPATPDSVTVKIDDKKPSEGVEDSESSDKEEEKEKKAESATDKAMRIAAMAGRPTSTGITAGAGLGALMATLGSLHRTNSEDKDHSVLSNPLLLGSLGLAAGYLGGNALDSYSDSDKKYNKGYLLPGLLSALGLNRIGKALAENDLDKEFEGVKNKYDRLYNALPSRGGKKTLSGISPERLKEYSETQNKLREVLERKGLTKTIEDLGLSSKSYKAPSLWSTLWKSTSSPVQHAKALNPIKEIDGQGKSGINLIRQQLSEIFRGTGQTKVPFFGKGSLNTKVLPARLAALALLTGGGLGAYRGIRNAISDD